MTRSERIAAQLAAKKEKLATERAQMKSLREDMAKAQTREKNRRYKMIGIIVEENGLLDWDDDLLRTAFREVAKNGSKYYKQQSIPELTETDVAAD